MRACPIVHKMRDEHGRPKASFDSRAPALRDGPEQSPPWHLLFEQNSRGPLMSGGVFVVTVILIA